MFRLFYHVTFWGDLLKRDFLDLYLKTSFGVRKFKNTSALTVILFLKKFKFESKFTKSKKKKEEGTEQIFFVSEIIASEKIAINCLCQEKILVMGSQWVNKQS